MKIGYFPALFALLITSCNSSTSAEGSSAADSLQSQQSGENSGFWEPLVWNEYKDNKGALIASMPYPANWKIAQSAKQGEPSITGPEGVKITDFPLQSFMFTNDPGMQQVWQQSGQRLRPLPGIDQLIQEDFIPWGSNRGLQFIRQYEIPEVSRIDKWYSDQLYKAMPQTQSEIKAFGTDWKSENGTPYFLIIHLNASGTNTMQNWYYYCGGLEADQDAFEKSRKQYIFSLSNTRYALEPIMAYNQSEAQKAGISWAAHNQRMAQNQANFEAQQRTFVNKSNAINDAIMSGYNERNASSDKLQEQRIDGIYERENVSDASGERYKVAAGANQYWMNSNGEYISSDRSDYNPNLDDHMNRERWQELKKVK